MGLYWDDGKENIKTTIVHWGNIRVILGLYRDNGKEHGNYCSILRIILEYLGIRVHGTCSNYLGSWEL